MPKGQFLTIYGEEFGTIYIPVYSPRIGPLKVNVSLHGGNSRTIDLKINDTSALPA